MLQVYYVPQSPAQHLACIHPSIPKFFIEHLLCSRHWQHAGSCGGFSPVEEHIQWLNECQVVRSMRRKIAGHLKSESDTRDASWRRGYQSRAQEGPHESLKEQHSLPLERSLQMPWGWSVGGRERKRRSGRWRAQWGGFWFYSVWWGSLGGLWAEEAHDLTSALNGQEVKGRSWETR